MSDRYDPDRAPYPWDEEGDYQPRPRRPSPSSRGGGGPRSGGRPPSRQPQPPSGQPPYGWDDGRDAGYGRPARPSRPLSDYPQSGYPQSGYPQQPYPPFPDYGQQGGYGDYGEYGPPPQRPSQGRGRQPGAGGAPYRDGDPYSDGRPRGRSGAGYGRQGGGMRDDDFGAAPTTGWRDDWAQPGYGRQAPPAQDPYFPMLPDPQSQAQARYGVASRAAATASRPEPARKRRSLKWLWITLAVVLVLLLALGGGAVWAIGQIAAPGVAAGEFCANLREQQYDAVYAQFTANMRTGLTQAQFKTAATDLDSAEGKVLNCQASGNVSYSLGSTTAQIGLIITRATQGSLTGNVHMEKVGGAWKVDAVDTALLGVNLGAVQAVEAYCAALQGQHYDTAYALLDSTQQGAETQSAYTSDAKLHDQIDGKVSACALKTVAAGNTDTDASVVLTVTRAKLGQSSGALKLTSGGAQWKITSIDQAVQGTNLLPLAAGQKFCSLLSQAKYTDAYNATSSGFKKATTSAAFMALFNVSGVKWSCGSAKLSTYKVSGDSASYVVPLTAKDAASGATLLSEDRGLLFVFESSAWKLQYFGDPAQLGD